MIAIKRIGQQVEVTTPYHPAFPPAARELGGQWRSPAWIFDARDEQRMRDLCLDIYHTDGSPCELVTLRCQADDDLWDNAGSACERYLVGRLVAKVFGKSDARARLGQGVIVTAGHFHGAGSAKNPFCGHDENTIFELRDVPRAAAKYLSSRHPGMVETIDSPLSPSPEALQVDPARQALIDERARLLVRLTEIDAALAALPVQPAVPPVFEVADELRDDL